MKKSDMVRGLLFGAEFFTNLFKEVVKIGGDEELMFKKMKTSEFAKEVAKLIVVEINDVKVSLQSFFQSNGLVKLFFGDNFKNWILSKMTETFPEPPKSKKNILPKRMTDVEIIKEFKIQPYKSVPELLSMLYNKLINQPNGEDGELLNNGYANLFYVQLEGRVVVVYVFCFSDDREWYLIANELDDIRWDDGSCVFSAADL